MADVVEESEGVQWTPTGEKRQISGRYHRFNSLLGKGAYKEVFASFDVERQIDVAWNQIDLSTVSSEEEKRKIYNECDMLRRLDHPSILKIHNQWYNDQTDMLCFITDIIQTHQGASLAKYIKRRRINVGRVKEICRQILDALQYLHDQVPPVIHRDLKCDNIFIEASTARVVIGDLGLSTQKPNSQIGPNATMSVVGTPHWMSPEMYTEQYNEKVDIWSFGMCVLEMVSGQIPYQECKTTPQVYKRVTGGKAPEILDQIKDSYVRSFIKMCLVFQPELRPSAQELLEHPFCRFDQVYLDKKPCYTLMKNSKMEPIAESANTNGATRLGSAVPTRAKPHHRHNGTNRPRKKDVLVQSSEKKPDGTTKIKLQIYGSKNGKPMAVTFSFNEQHDTIAQVALEMVRELRLTEDFHRKVEEAITNALNGNTDQPRTGRIMPRGHERKTSQKAADVTPGGSHATDKKGGERAVDRGDRGGGGERGGEREEEKTQTVPTQAPTKPQQFEENKVRPTPPPSNPRFSQLDSIATETTQPQQPVSAKKPPVSSQQVMVPQQPPRQNPSQQQSLSSDSLVPGMQLVQAVGNTRPPPQHSVSRSQTTEVANPHYAMLASEHMSRSQPDLQLFQQQQLSQAYQPRPLPYDGSTVHVGSRGNSPPPPQAWSQSMRTTAAQIGQPQSLTHTQSLPHGPVTAISAVSTEFPLPQIRGPSPQDASHGMQHSAQNGQRQSLRNNPTSASVQATASPPQSQPAQGNRNKTSPPPPTAPTRSVTATQGPNTQTGPGLYRPPSLPIDLRGSVPDDNGQDNMYSPFSVKRSIRLPLNSAKMAVWKAILDLSKEEIEAELKTRNTTFNPRDGHTILAKLLSDVVSKEMQRKLKMRQKEEGDEKGPSHQKPPSPTSSVTNFPPQGAHLVDFPVTHMDAASPPPMEQMMGGPGVSSPPNPQMYQPGETSSDFAVGLPNGHAASSPLPSQEGVQDVPRLVDYGSGGPNFQPGSDASGRAAVSDAGSIPPYNPPVPMYPAILNLKSLVELLDDVPEVQYNLLDLEEVLQLQRRLDLEVDVPQDTLRDLHLKLQESRQEFVAWLETQTQLHKLQMTQMESIRQGEDEPDSDMDKKVQDATDDEYAHMQLSQKKTHQKTIQLKVAEVIDKFDQFVKQQAELAKLKKRAQTRTERKKYESGLVYDLSDIPEKYHDKLQRILEEKRKAVMDEWVDFVNTQKQIYTLYHHQGSQGPPQTAPYGPGNGYPPATSVAQSAPSVTRQESSNSESMLVGGPIQSQQQQPVSRQSSRGSNTPPDYYDGGNPPVQG